MNEITYISLFSGIGGFELGLENSKHNFKCLGYSEIDKYARSIYERHYPNHTYLGDATKIKTEELPNFDLLVGGFPCQAFSVAGKRKDLKIQEVHSFLKLHGFSKTKDPDIFYSKTYGVYFLMTREKLSRQSLKFSPTWGISLGGVCLTAKTLEFHNGERGCLLKDILEENVDEKYYLKEEIANRILKN